MNSAKHTPGPWELRDDEPTIFGADSSIIGEIIEEADAALVVAAPELLDSLIKAVGMIPQGIVDCAGSKCRQRNCEACSFEPEEYDVSGFVAVIAKAMGSTPAQSSASPAAAPIETEERD